MSALLRLDRPPRIPAAPGSAGVRSGYEGDVTGLPPDADPRACAPSAGERFAIVRRPPHRLGEHQGGNAGPRFPRVERRGRFPVP